MIIPERGMVWDDWGGTGYLILNPETRAGEYMISGGLFGGSTSTAVTIAGICAIIAQIAMIVLLSIMVGSLISAFFGAILLMQIYYIVCMLITLVSMTERTGAMIDAVMRYASGSASGDEYILREFLETTIDLANWLYMAMFNYALGKISGGTEGEGNVGSEGEAGGNGVGEGGNGGSGGTGNGGSGGTGEGGIGGSGGIGTGEGTGTEGSTEGGGTEASGGSGTGESGSGEGNGSAVGGGGNYSICISQERLQHSVLGEFNSNGRLINGGHGQANIDFLDQNNIEYNIVKEYNNGVRVGNIPSHKNKFKRTGTGQAWFPKSWTEIDIKNAGEYIANIPENVNVPDGTWFFGEYNGVRVGIIKNNGKIGTIVPDNSRQP